MPQPTVPTPPDGYPATASDQSNYVQRLTEGDAAAERYFVRCFSPLLRIKLQQHLESPEPVEDLRREVLLRVLRSLRQGSALQNPESLGAYVHSICNNVLLEYSRGKSKWGERDPDAGVERELISEDQGRQIRRLIDGMTPQDRVLIQAIFLEQRDQDTVCREQGVGRDYPRLLLHRTRKRFRQLLTGGHAPATRDVTGFAV